MKMVVLTLAFNSRLAVFPTLICSDAEGINPAPRLPGSVNFGCQVAYCNSESYY
jgi:hypothetical protein